MKQLDTFMQPDLVMIEEQLQPKLVNTMESKKDVTSMDSQERVRALYLEHGYEMQEDSFGTDNDENIEMPQIDAVTDT